MLENIRIVLLETSHSGNIGATARAMKTMGFSELVLVSPKNFPSEQAIAMSAGAEDVLEQAKVVGTIEEALEGCQLVLGTSGRKRLVDWPLLTPKEMVPFVQKALSQSAKIAILFGTERTGLTNSQLEKCHYHINIPSNPEYCSLNLAQAVQVICYELRSSLLEFQPLRSEEEPLADAKEVEQFYKHFEQAITAIQFLDPTNPRHLMTRVRKLFQRVRLTHSELNILRGICTAILNKVKFK
ncbi:MAG: tRNA (cytosine(32)/uridine(32)-2'-O)-methyltransferase TrmJ [Gammaproteobacteria bacterium]|nr:tRNA (cytosine(32)/uridine(32)-2'-O)-methyltransferase TrmJ [Gammaproteobacteria bacterium]